MKDIELSRAEWFRLKLGYAAAFAIVIGLTVHFLLVQLGWV